MSNATNQRRSREIHADHSLRRHHFDERTAILGDDNTLPACGGVGCFGEPRFGLCYGKLHFASPAAPALAPDHAQILRLGGVRDQDRHRRSFRRCACPFLGASLLKRLKHAPSLALRGAGVTGTARRQVKHAGIQRVGQSPGRPPAGPLVHVPPHRCHLASALYHIEGPVRNNRSPGRPASVPATPAIA
jgi:hypothetical protein